MPNLAGRLDRYVAAAVFGAYGAALLFLVGMFMVFDLLFQMNAPAGLEFWGDDRMFEMGPVVLFNRRGVRCY